MVWETFGTVDPHDPGSTPTLTRAGVTERPQAPGQVTVTLQTVGLDVTARVLPTNGTIDVVRLCATVLYNWSSCTLSWGRLASLNINFELKYSPCSIFFFYFEEQRGNRALVISHDR